MIVRHRFQVTVKRTQWVPTEDGKGGRSEQLPDTTEWVEVEVDFAKLAGVLGPKACRSAGGRSQEAGGLVVVRKVK